MTLAIDLGRKATLKHTHLFILKQLAIILTRTRVLVALLLLFFGCLVTVNVLWLFLLVPCVGLQCVIVVFPEHTRLLFVDSLFIAAPVV